MPRAGKLLETGQLDESLTTVQAVFPKDKRTPAEAFLLANVVFKLDPKTSYALHKESAAALPDQVDVQYELALEQHRAGEYTGALATYTKVSKAKPNRAVVYGLSAECLLRLGKTKEAVAMWQRSESAPQDTLVDLETVVCEVNNHATPERDRATWLAKAKKGDLESARRLIALDCDFARDWWNGGPNAAYLANDLAVLRKAKFADGEQLKEILCAGDCALAAKKERDFGEVLRKQGFLLDAAHTLPKHGSELLIMLRHATGADVIKQDDARNQWGQTVRELAHKNRDAEMFTVAGYLYNGTPDALAIDQKAWDDTGDVRFAEALFTGKGLKHDLRLDDAGLAAAVKKFPDDAILAGIVVRLTAQAGKPLEGPLTRAIKAEYTKFSPGSHRVGVDLPRPGAELLQRYFRMLAKDLDAK
jgi:tetratricopeptide (TPR) repeat protein